MITLHGANASPFVRKVMAVLAMKNLPYEHVQQMPFTGDTEYQKISPLGKIPALQDGDLTISDSKVICRYLESAYPEIPVYPAGLEDRARADWYEEFGGTVLAETAASIFFHRVMRPMFMKKEVDTEAVEKIIERKLPPQLDYMESQVPADGFLFGDIGVADIALASCFINAGYGDYAVDAERWPKTAAFIQRVIATPLITGLMAAEGFAKS